MLEQSLCKQYFAIVIFIAMIVSLNTCRNVMVTYCRELCKLIMVSVAISS